MSSEKGEELRSHIVEREIQDRVPMTNHTLKSQKGTDLISLNQIENHIQNLKEVKIRERKTKKTGSFKLRKAYAFR